MNFTTAIISFFVGGIALKYFGGPLSNQILDITQILCWLTIVTALPLPFISNFTVFGALVWVLYFLVQTIMVMLNCMMFSSVDVNMQSAANGLLTFSYNFLGWMPAPFIYVAIQSLTNSSNSL